MHCKPTFWWACVGVWFAVLFIASSQSGLVPPMLFSWQDKLEHALYFCAGGLALNFALRTRQPAVTGLLLVVCTVLFCSLNGAFDEWHQTFTPGRSGNDVWDWLADTTGGVLAAMISPLLAGRIRR